MEKPLLSKHAWLLLFGVLMLVGCGRAICDYYAAYEVQGEMLDSSDLTPIGNAYLEIELLRDGSLVGSDLSARTNHQGGFHRHIIVERVGGLCGPDVLPTASLGEPPDSVVIRVSRNGLSEEITIPITEPNLTIQSMDRGIVSLGEIQIELGNTKRR